jgi:hypothetical protein
VNGTIHHFSAGGLYNGLVLLVDDETRTYWDHMSGEALHGKLAGARLETWPVPLTTVAAALEEDPDLALSRSSPSLLSRLMGLFAGRALRGRGFMPPVFRGTMERRDDRLPEMTHGLGVRVGGEARFYPTSAIGDGVEDDWSGRVLRVQVGKVDRIPYAEWDDGSRPWQVFSRWYGFALSYPGCGVFTSG